MNVLYNIYLTIFWIFVESRDFGNKWKILFPVSGCQQNAVSRLYNVSLGMFHGWVANPENCRILVLLR